MSDTSIISFREMRDGDYDQVAVLWHKTKGMGLDPELDSREGIGNYLVKNNGLSFVATVSETADNAQDLIIGTVLCGTDGRRGYLMHLAVEKKFRQRGIGRRLVDCALSALKHIGINKAHVFVFKDNTSGADFWRKSGWQGRGDLLMLSMERDGSCC